MFTNGLSTIRECEVVLIEERASELRLCSEVKVLSTGAAGKPSLNRAKELHVYDPKPGDLSMSRLKLG